MNILKKKKNDRHRFLYFHIMDSQNMFRKMSKKSCFRGPIDKQHGKRAQTLLKSAPQDLYHVYWSLRRQVTQRKSLLLICQILGLLANTLAADDRYPVPNRENLMIPIEMQLSQKQKTFAYFFSAFLKSTLNFEDLKKKVTLIDFVLPKFRTSKSWLDKCLKSPVSEDPSTSNMVNVPRHCWNLHDSTFIEFINHFEGNWVLKSLC